MIEITADIFLQKDDKDGNPLIDVILDEAKQKGTGEWTALDALDLLQVPTFNIYTAVMMRYMSADISYREKAGRLFKWPNTRFQGERALFIPQI